MLDVLASRKLC